jgi:hypothetical protein
MIKTSMIKEYLKDPKQNYLTFNIKYSKKELDYLDNLNIIKKTTFNFTGNIDDFNNNKLNKFLNSIGDNQNINILNNIIYKLLKKITSAYQTKYCWMTIRVTLPMNDYDEPRWHKDGNFFQNPIKETSKFLTILKGPGTLFIKKSKKVNEIYNKYQIIKYEEKKKLGNYDYNEEFENKYKKIYVKEFKDFKYNQLKTRDGLIFFTGNQEDEFKNGLLHSEPKKDVPRFFISILPGSESEIAEYDLSQKMYNDRMKKK